MIFLTLFLTFFKIGLFTVGGGYAMLPLIQSEISAHGWLAQEQLLDFIAISESTPGPFAINIATFTGTQLAGIPGGICATLGVITPSFVIILIVAKFYMQFKNSKTVSGIMSGLKPTVIGLIGSAVVTTAITVFFPTGMAVSVLSSAAFYVSAAIFILTLVLALKKVNPIILICICAVLGIAVCYALNINI